MKKIFTLWRIITSNIMMMKNYYLAASFIWQSRFTSTARVYD